MACQEISIIEQLRQLVLYDAETGAISWKPRRPEMFTDFKMKSGHYRSAESICAAWNTKYAGKPAFSTPQHSGHLTGKVNHVSFMAHRVAWIVHYGRNPRGQIDHINGIPSDNRIVNLREVGIIGNRRNLALTSRNSHGHLGVTFDKRADKWAARIGSGATGDSIHLGTFNTKAEAIAARRAGEVILLYHENHGRALPSDANFL